MRLNLWRDEIEITPLVPPYAHTDSYVLGPLHAEIEHRGWRIPVPDFLAGFFARSVRWSLELLKKKN